MQRCIKNFILLQDTAAATKILIVGEEFVEQDCISTELINIDGMLKRNVVIYTSDPDVVPGNSVGQRFGIKYVDKRALFLLYCQHRYPFKKLIGTLKINQQQSKTPNISVALENIQFISWILKNNLAERIRNFFFDKNSQLAEKCVAEYEKNGNCLSKDGKTLILKLNRSDWLMLRIDTEINLRADLAKLSRDNLNYCIDSVKYTFVNFPILEYDFLRSILSDWGKKTNMKSQLAIFSDYHVQRLWNIMNDQNINIYSLPNDLSYLKEILKEF